MDRRIGLDREQFGHRDAGGRGDARQVVAEQIDDHQIFGALLGIVAEHRGERAILVRRSAAPRRALHRLGGQLHAVEREEQFGRQRQQPVDPRRHHRAVPGARVRPQPRIERERIARDRHAGAVAEIGLIEVARLDQRMDAVEAVGIGGAVDIGLGRADPGRGGIGQQAWHVLGRDLVIPLEQPEPQQRRRRRRQPPSTGSNAAAASYAMNPAACSPRCRAARSRSSAGFTSINARASTIATGA